MVQVIALAGTLTDAGKDRVAAVLGSDVADQLLDDDGLADTGAAEQADLTALHEWQMRSMDLIPVSNTSAFVD